MEGYAAGNGRLGQGQGCTDMKSDREINANGAGVGGMKKWVTNVVDGKVLLRQLNLS